MLGNDELVRLQHCGWGGFRHEGANQAVHRDGRRPGSLRGTPPPSLALPLPFCQRLTPLRCCSGRERVHDGPCTKHGLCSNAMALITGAVACAAALPSTQSSCSKYRLSSSMMARILTPLRAAPVSRASSTTPRSRRRWRSCGPRSAGWRSSGRSRRRTTTAPVGRPD